MVCFSKLMLRYDLNNTMIDKDDFVLDRGALPAEFPLETFNPCKCETNNK